MTESPPSADESDPGSRAHKAVLSPAIQSAIGIEAWGEFVGTVDFVALVGEVNAENQKVSGGDLQPIEAMLFGQASTLQTIFTNLSIRAQRQENLKVFQGLLTLALKAQAQCRATLETLAEIKNPRAVAFVRQANFAQQQQVNNGAVGSLDNAREGEMPITQNELLEAPHVDSRAQIPAIATHPDLGAVVARNRTSNT